MPGESKLGSAYIPIRATLDELDNDLSGVRGKVEGALAGVQDLGKVALGGLAAGALGVAAAIGTIGPAAISSASDLNESWSKAGVVFGTSVGIIDEFAKTSARSFGISKQAAYESAGTFGNLFTTMGLGKNAAAGMSVDIVKLAADLASFNNLNSDVVLEKLRAGLVGEAEPLRTMGINITEAAVQAKAMSMNLGGLTVNADTVAKAENKVYEATKSMYVAELKYGTSSMEWRAKQMALTDAQNALNAARRGSAGPLTDAMKLQARFALIMEQSTTAQGDFARTSDGLANTQRILGATWKDLLAKLGTAFLPVVIGLAQALIPIVDVLMPKFESVLATLSPILTDIGNSVGIFVEVLTRTGDPLQAMRGALENFPNLQPIFESLVAGVQSFLASIQPIVDQVTAWISQNVSLQDVLIALGIAIAAVVIPAILSIVAAVAPIVLAFVALVAIVSLLRTAWETDWNGMRTKLTEFWEGTAQPALAQLWQWLQVNVPAALQTLANFWTTVLQPAILAVWTWITTVLIPMLQDVWNWLAVNVPAAIQTLANFWNNVLLPAITAIWNYIQTKLLPVFVALVTLGIHVVQLAVEALGLLWEKVFLPILQKVYDFIDKNLLPIFIEAARVVKDVFGAALTWVNENVLKPFIETINFIIGAIMFLISVIEEAIAALGRLINKIKGSPLLGGSPSPLEISIKGISAAMNELSSVELSQLSTSMAAVPGVDEGNGSAGSQQQIINIYGLTLEGVTDKAGLLESLQSLA